MGHPRRRLYDDGLTHHWKHLELDVGIGIDLRIVRVERHMKNFVRRATCVPIQILQLYPNWAINASSAL